jgi:hypothetical protein
VSEFFESLAGRHGVLTTAEGVAEFGRSGFQRRTRAGQFERELCGIWRVAGSPRTLRQQLMTYVLAIGDVASFRSTLALAGVPGFTLLIPELTSEGYGNVRRVVGEKKVHIHRTNVLPRTHRTTIDGIPSTTLARALCDVSAVMSGDRLAGVFDDCKRLDLVTFDEIASVREDIRARGRRRTTVVDRLLEERIDGWAVGESRPEDKVLRWLAEGGFVVVPQHWVVARGRRRRIDVALPDDRVAVEYQGIKEHATATAVIRDSEKVTDLQLAGWFVVLVTKHTTKREFLDNVREAVRRQREHRDPV